MAYQRHNFHLVDPSPWPLMGGLSGFVLWNGFTLYLHSFQLGKLTFLLGMFLVLLTMIVWWRDVIREATYQGHHTKAVQKGLRLGIILFIVSELMFFFAFFWAFFSSSFVPTIDLGSIWPPEQIIGFNPWDVPLLNTTLLLSSGLTATWAHQAILAELRDDAIISLLWTLLLAIIFTSLQAFEYMEAIFSIADSVYGSIFYLATGFHGIHVLIGTLFLIVCLARLIFYHFTKKHHFGFEAAAWYWHFVDVVWLFLFITIYWWGSL